MQAWAVSFYKSLAWKNTRAAFAASKKGLCEICLEKGLYVPGEIVHHKIHLTQNNINDESITLAWNNLQLVCRDCHAAIHSAHARRYRVDAQGRVLPTPPGPEK